MTTILDNIRRLVERLAPAPVCDDCLTERVDPTATEDIRTAIGELTVTRGFDRIRDACSLCGEHKMVIRKLK